MAAPITIPRLGWSMEEGTFVGWLKQSGDSVAVGDPLFELEGEKALQEIESVDAGTLYISPDAPQPGSVVAVGSLLGYLLAPGEAPPATREGEAPAEPHGAEGVASCLPPPAGPSVRRLARELGVSLDQLTAGGSMTKITADDVVARAMQRGTAHAGGSLRSNPATHPGNWDAVWESPAASPRARRVAAELGVDWTRLRGSGRGGRVREADVRAAAESGVQASSLRIHSPLPSEAERLAGAISLSPRRKAIIAHLRRTQTLAIPVTLTTTADATHLVALRAQFKSHGGLVPAYTDLIACLAARVLRQHPALCVRWTPDHNALVPVADDAIDIGIAVDTQDGLIVPVVRDVARASLLAVADSSRKLIDTARDGRLTKGDMQGAVLTISNLGAYGIEAFTPVINDPEIAILGLGAIRREPVVLSDDRIVPQDRITLSLTFDHAAVDGAPAAAFLRDVAAAVAAPAVLLMGT
ncbi:MAG: 2-oxo acid dehydrogenase subunit E2 [Planctomycetaceae bacterium]|nr:2-oxo acid dehydrogenase subunit E2 [Planctomycetaceae bacterium]